MVSGIAHAEAGLKACLGSSWCTAGLRLTKKYFATDDEADDDGQPFAELFVNEREQALVLPVPGIRPVSKDRDEATRLHFTLDISAGTLEVQVDFGQPVLLLGPVPHAVLSTTAIKLGEALFTELFAGAWFRVCLRGLGYAFVV